MPGMTGIELFNRIKLVRPDLPVVLMTGFAVEDQVEDAMARGAFAVLPKPFDVDKAAQVLENAARKPEVLVVVEGLASSASTIAMGLTTVGVRARGVGDVEAAVGELRAQPPIDVCVADLGAPKAQGDGALARLRASDPRLVIIGIAPAKESEKVLSGTARQVHTLVARPFRLKDLVRLVSKARARPVR
jgi:DNA-binding NtrC family response regulator